MSPREQLPHRREAVTETVEWPPIGGRPIHVTAGLAPDGRILECFLRAGGQAGSERDLLLDDVAVLVSRALQHGDGLDLLARGVGRLPDGSPASVVGAAVDAFLGMTRP